MLISVVLLVSGAYLIWFMLLRKSDLPPGPYKFPFIGNIWWFLLQKRRKIRIPVALLDATRTYGDVIHFQVGKKNIVFLHGFDAINDAFVKQADVFSFRPDLVPTDKEKQGKGVVFENGNAFRVMQSFIMKVLNSETVSIEEKILIEIDAATDYLDAEIGKPLDMKLLLSMMVTNVIYNFIFGKRFDYADEAFSPLLSNLGTVFRSGSSIDASAMIPKFILKLVKTGKMERAKQENLEAGEWVKDHIKKQIEEHETTFNEYKLRDFVDCFIKEQKRKPEKEIFTQDRLYYVIRDLFVAGSEASAVTLNWMILYMQEYPEAQQKCQREIREKCGDRRTQLAHRGDLPYVESTLKEIQRMANVAETTLPHATMEETSFRGYRIPKHSVVLANLLSSNKDRRYWDDPNTFIPERFLQDTAQKNPAFLPLGLGPRKCLGESLAKKELFLIITNFLQRFTFQREDPNVRHTFNCIDGQLTATPLPYKTRIVKRQ